MSMTTTPFDLEVSRQVVHVPIVTSTDPSQRDSSRGKVTVPIGQIIHRGAEHIQQHAILPT
jgi:hypothetical protein